jgi:flagellar P-ring protein precursor FlgI
MITAELPPYATNGLPIDVSVQSMGDAKSIACGTLLQAPLFAAGDHETVYAMAQGSITLGGFDVSAGGSSVSKNFVTAGRVPGGALVQKGAATKVIYPEGKMYIDLDAADITTSQRIAGRISEAYPFLKPVALNAGTVEITLPTGSSDVQTMSQIEQLDVMVDSTGTIVVNEKTGTIVMGGNVRVGPAVIAHGSLNVRIDEEVIISQPAPLSQGKTVVTGQSTIGAGETNAQIATIAPTTTVSDLARIFEVLELKAADIISILQGLRQQGALKARIITQ